MALPGDREADSTRCDMKDNGEVDERVSAVRTLRASDTEDSHLRLVEALDDRSGAVRRYAAQALGVRGSPLAITPLLSRTEDPDALVQWTVHRALARFADQRIEDLARKYLQRRKRRDQVLGSLLIIEHTYECLQTIVLPGLSSPDPFIRALSTNIISKRGNMSDSQQKKMLDDPDPAVREEASRQTVRASREPRVPRVSLQADLDRVRGSLWGVFVGDALGAQVESLTLDQIRAQFGWVISYVGAAAGQDHLVRAAGSYTDDGEMTLALMDSLANTGGFSAIDAAANFSRIAFSIDDDFDRNRGYGSGTLMALRQIYSGVNWRFAGNDSEGCGAAMRVAPLAALRELRQEDIIEQARTTHQNAVAIGGAVALAKAIHEAYSLRLGLDKTVFIDTVADYAEPISPQVASEIRNLKKLLGRGTAEVLESLPFGPSQFRRKGKGTMAVVPAAIYCFLKSPDSFETSVTAAVNNSGDSDSIASMAGAISGAYNGYEGIPEPLISGLQGSDFVSRKIERFIGSFPIRVKQGE